MQFRNLRADEVDCRVSTISEKGLSLLLYKDARCDQKILDETVGCFGWQREHYECKGNLFCRVGLLDDTGNWIWKSDCGKESYTESEKGEASDSFKRACFNWGIGRELYTAPFIWIKVEDCNITVSGNKKVCRDKFTVEHMLVENGQIVELSIYNKTKHKCVFSLTKKDNDYISQIKIKVLNSLCEQTGTDKSKVFTAYGVPDFSKFTEKQFIDLSKVLNDRLEKQNAKK